MRKHTLAFVSTIAVLAATANSATANELANPGFEDNVSTYTNGNNFPGTVTGWTFGGGQSPNVVKVDGAGGYDYGSNGPEMDADAATGAGVDQHYLDITNGSNSFYQTFTPSCSGNVEFGGSFSSRANRRATASISILEGNGLGGALVGATQSISTPFGNSKTTPWTDVSYTTTLVGGQTYSFVVTMDNDSNFDDAFVEFDNCPGTEEVNLCCPPWTKTKLSASLQPVPGPGGLASNYGINYQSVAASDNAMQAYTNYLNLVNPSVDHLQVDYVAKDFGSGATPIGSGSSVPGAGPQTVTHYGTSTVSGSFWSGFLFQQETWYGFATRVTARDSSGNDLHLYDDVDAAGNRICPNAVMYYRVQSLGLDGMSKAGGSSGLIVQISDGKRIISTQPLASVKAEPNFNGVPIRRPNMVRDRTGRR